MEIVKIILFFVLPGLVFGFIFLKKFASILPNTKLIGELETKPTGFWIRFASGLVDAIIIFFIWLITQLVIGLPMFLVIIFIFVYFAILPIGLWTGQTIGKRIFRIRVVKVNSGILDPATMFIRVLIGDFYIISLGVGLII